MKNQKYDGQLERDREEGDQAVSNIPRDQDAQKDRLLSNL